MYLTKIISVDTWWADVEFFVFLPQATDGQCCRRKANASPDRKVAPAQIILGRLRVAVRNLGGRSLQHKAISAKFSCICFEFYHKLII